MKTILLLILSAVMTGCTIGPDATPDVMSAAASFSGATFSPQGAMMSRGTAPQHRSTMLVP